MRIFGNSIQQPFGSTSFNATVGQNAINVYGVPSNYAAFVQGGSTAGTSLGLLIEAGTNSSDVAFYVRNAANTLSLFQVRGDGYITIANGGVSISGSGANQSLLIAANGTNLSNVQVNSVDQATLTPTIYSSSYASALEVTSGGTSVNSGGILLFSADNGNWKFGAIKGCVTNAANNTVGDLSLSLRQSLTDTILTEVMHWYSGGGVTIGAATGGSQGAGTLNVSGGLYVNGVSVSGGGTVLSAHKTTTTSRTSNATPSADPDLTVSIASTGTYAFSLLVRVSCSNVGAMAFGMNYTGTKSLGQATVSGVSNGANLAYDTGVNAFNPVNSWSGTSGGSDFMYLEGTITATSTGTLSFNWAEFTSNAGGCSVLLGSNMVVTKIN